MSFIDVGHNPTCISMLTFAAMGSRGCPPFGYFSNPEFSKSLSIKTQNEKSCEHMLMLKQGVKTINIQFIQTRALPKFSFIQFRPYGTSFVRFLLPLTLISKSKKILKPEDEFRPYTLVQDLCWLLTQGSKVLFRMRFICKICTIILIKIYMAEKDICCAHTFHSLDCFILWFFFLYRLFTLLMIPKGKKEWIRLFPISLNNFYSFFHFLV